MDETRLKIEGLKIGFQQGARVVPAVDSVSLELRKGEMLALLGESGSGKSLTALSLLGLLPRPAGKLLGGHAWFDGKDLYALPEAELRKIRGHRIAMIFQEPMTALNPLMTVGDQLGEVLKTHFGMRGEALTKRCVELLNEVEIPEAASRLKKHLSSGTPAQSAGVYSLRHVAARRTMLSRRYPAKKKMSLAWKMPSPIWPLASYWLSPGSPTISAPRAGSACAPSSSEALNVPAGSFSDT